MAVIPPPFVITDNDKQGLIVVFTAIALSFVWTCFCIRIWLRCRSLHVKYWSLDDSFLAGATLLGTAQSAAVLSAVNSGLGKSLSVLVQSQLEEIAQAELAAQLLYVFALLASKCAVLFLYLRLSPHPRHLQIAWATIVVCILWAVASIVLVVIPCNANEFWVDGQGCLDLWPRIVAIGAVDIVTEAIIVLDAILLVAPLNMKRSEKFVVIIAFCARLPVIIAAAFRLICMHATAQNPDRTLQGSYTVIATQWHVGYAIMSTTITGLGPFLRPFTRSMTYHTSSGKQHSQSPKDFPRGKLRIGTPEVFAMHRLNIRDASPSPFPDKYSPYASTFGVSDELEMDNSSELPLVLRPDLVKRPGNTIIIGGRKELEDEEEDEEKMLEDIMGRPSGNSEQLIIKKETTWTVETDSLRSTWTPERDTPYPPRP